jgi:cobalt/nickel transport system permease protein
LRLGDLHSHLSMERWSRSGGWLQRRDPRAKILGTLALLAAISLTPANWRAGAAAAAGLAAITWGAGLPLTGLLRRIMWILPFTALFAGITALAGEPVRAAGIAGKTLLSAWVTLILAATTPIESLLEGLRRLGAPHFLLTVVHFIWRYLFVVAEQAHRMHLAAHARGSQRVFHAAAGGVAVLFARSYARAEAVYRSMLARGFTGTLPLMRPLRFTWADAGLLAAAIGGAAGLRWWGAA